MNLSMLESRRYGILSSEGHHVQGSYSQYKRNVLLYDSIKAGTIAGHNASNQKICNLCRGNIQHTLRKTEAKNVIEDETLQFCLQGFYVAFDPSKLLFSLSRLGNAISQVELATQH